MRAIGPLVLSGFVLAGCVGDGTTPYPNLNPIEGARVSANPFPRGSAAFCAQYGRQTAANRYEQLVSRSEDGLGYRLILEQQARRAGADAEARCRQRQGRRS